MKEAINFLRSTIPTTIDIQYDFKTEQDIINGFRIENYPVKRDLTVADLPTLCRKIIEDQEQFAQSLNVKLQVTKVEEKEKSAEVAPLKIGNEVFVSTSYPESKCRALVNEKWFSILLEKLVDIGILLGSGKMESVLTLERIFKKMNWICQCYLKMSLMELKMNMMELMMNNMSVKIYQMNQIYLMNPNY